MATARQVLIYLSLKHQGEWEKIYEDIVQKVVYPSEEIEKVTGDLKINTVTILDKEYPEPLKQINKPPFVLFYYGDFSLLSDYQNCLAVVGSRNYSEYGKTATINIIKDLKGKFTIISGLALGIDSIAHEAALDSNAKTVAILGSGIDYCYPKSNTEIYQKIKQNHLIISEYPGNVEPKPEHFPIRNRLIAALAKSILVTEAKKKSGTLITVSLAASIGRNIMCVPYPINQDSECNQLIKDGAYLVENGQDVIEYM